MSNSIVYLIGNSDTATIPTKIDENDIIVMFNVPKINIIQPDIVFIANTFHPARRFVKSKCYKAWDKNKTTFIFPFSDEIIKKSPVHRAEISFFKKLKRWKNNSYKKCINGFKHHFLPETVYKEVLKYLKLDSNEQVPSTGLIAIFYFMMLNYKIVITGFTFEGIYLHNWEKEKKIVYELIKNGKVSFLIS